MEMMVCQKVGKVLLFLGLCRMFYPADAFAQSARKKILEGNGLFSEEKYDEANNIYQDALLDNPTSSAIQFNIGNVLYKKSDFEKALESYYQSLDTDDPVKQSQAYYNIGNSLFRAGKLPESILAYEQALKLNPADEDAKYNLEYVRNQMKQNAQPQPADQQKEPQTGQQENQDESQQEQQEKAQEEQQSESEIQEGEQDKKEMTKEEAERLLEALKEKQEELKQKRMKAQGKVRVKKDW